MNSSLRTLPLLAMALTMAVTQATAQVVQERVDLDAFRQIREEGLERSQIEELAGYLTDVIGPRLTGSPQMRQANDWTAEKLREWGLENVVVEAWGEFGRGWSNVRYEGRILEPYLQQLNALPVAWTGGTDGTVEGPAVVIDVESAAELEPYRGKLRGAFAMMREPGDFEPEFDPQPLRLPVEELLEPAVAPDVDREERRRRIAEFRRLFALRDSISTFLAGEDIAGALAPSSRTYMILRVWGDRSARSADAPIPRPELVLAHEQYSQIWRNVERGIPVRLEVNIENEFHEDDLNAYNTLADLPGTERPDEYVMIGAHLDSWYGGTGATDNAAGSVVMMEAMRILQTLDLRPRRTIRIALWSGEEQGLLGSRNWVANHEELHPKISAYLNVDNGTGRIRGIRTQGNQAAVPVFEQILWPFTDLGVVVVQPARAGGTDHLAFDRAGIPGFNFIQDPIEYFTRTHHTYADRFERLVIDDLKQAAVVVAATAYHLAMRDEMMPRKEDSETTTETR